MTMQQAINEVISFIDAQAHAPGQPKARKAAAEIGRHWSAIRDTVRDAQETR